MSSENNAQKESVASEGAAAPEKKPRLLLSALAAAACCGAAGAGSYMLAPTVFGSVGDGSAKSEHLSDPSTVDSDHKKTAAKSPKKNKSGKPADKGHGSESGESADGSGASRFYVTGATGVFALRPIVVTLKPQGRVRYLKVILAIETAPESERSFIDSELRIIDILTSYLRAVPVAAIEDPVAMARIREQIARRVAFIVDPAPVDGVLITDFILS